MVGSGWARRSTPPFGWTARLCSLAFVASATATAGPSAFACGPGGYIYAGVAAPARAFGIRAVVTPVLAPDVHSGHVAGWVGVGGPEQGPGGTDEWLQVGLSAFPGQTGEEIYYEVAVPGGQPSYHRLGANVPVGTPVELAIVEMRGRPDWWRVWRDGSVWSEPMFLPGSDGRWAPIATTESWDGGTAGSCTNSFLFRFHHILVARARGGRWQALSGGSMIRSSGANLRRADDSFLGASGPSALRRLGSTTP
ncbi:MAG: hypothetical protein ACXVY6_12345 [Gaiellaceae bacterium]